MDEWRECIEEAGFIQRIVVLCQKGYPYYLSGRVKAPKDPCETDRKMLGKYPPEFDRSKRCRRKKVGLENGHYLRHGRVWVLMMTHPDFVREVDAKEQVGDMRSDKTSLQVLDYSIGLRRDGSAKRKGQHKLRASVRLSKEYYRDHKAFFEDKAVHWSAERIGEEMWRVSSFHVKYAPIHRQWRAILNRVNALRKTAGLGRVPYKHIRWYQASPKHFGCRNTDTISAGQNENEAA